jgi:hypothetical protein
LKKLLFAILFVTTFSVLQAQYSKVYLLFSPQQLLVNTAKLDIEYSPSKREKYSLVLTPSLINGKSNRSTFNKIGEKNDEGELDQMSGFGLGLSHKLYVNEGLRIKYKSKPFFQYGVSYSKTTLVYGFKDPVNSSGVPNGTLVLNTNPDKEGKDKFSVYGLQMIIGNSYKITDRFDIELYLGIATRKTKQTTQNLGARNYNRFFLDYGYSGWLPQCGFKFSIAL